MRGKKNPKYVYEKMRCAVECLCGEGLFMARLYDATVSALGRMEDDDLTGNLGKDWEYILRWTKHNIKAGGIQSEPSESERNLFVEKMIRVLIETTKRRWARK